MSFFVEKEVPNLLDNFESIIRAVQAESRQKKI
jgi:hypothetical protein